MPLWLWDVARTRIAWANRACLEFTGALSVDDLVRLKFSPDLPFIGQLARLSQIGDGMQGTRELIRFPAANGEYVLDCLCRAVQVEPGRPGVLVGLVADRGKVPPVRDPVMANGVDKAPVNDKAHANGVLKTDEFEQGAVGREPPGNTPVSAPDVNANAATKTKAKPQVVPEAKAAPEPPADPLTDQEVNGFQIEAGEVDEEDLLTLQEIARMINGAGGGGVGPSGGGMEASADPRPRVATRAISGISPPALPESKVAAPSLATATETASSPVLNGRLSGGIDVTGATTSATTRPDPPAMPAGERGRPAREKSVERNYFLESLPAALAIAMGGRLMRANEAFLYAFGFGSESELRRNGGLAALFPESGNGVLVAESPTNGRRPSGGKKVRSSRVTTLAVSRSGRRRRIPIAFRNVSTGRDPVQILILHEDALWQDGDPVPEDAPQEQGGGAGNEGPRVFPGDAGHDKERLGQDSIDFLANVSHEVRTPLNSIIGFSELMKDERFGAVDGDRFRDYAGDIHASARHALSLINDLLDITKIIAGKPDLKFETVETGDVIRDALRTMATQAQRGGVRLKTSLQDDLPPLYADRRSLTQILLNLLSNAIKFTPPGGDVLVSSFGNARGGVHLVVRDTGIGMQKELIETALEPFSQLARTPEQGQAGGQAHEKGTGLGLPLTKALVKAHNASFAIDSGPGQGTRVEIIFPPRPEDHHGAGAGVHGQAS